MGIFESGILSGIGCGCCCAAVAAVLAIAAVLGFRGKRGAVAPLPGQPAAPARGSSTQARLTFMGEPEATEVDETVQLRPSPRGTPTPAASVPHATASAPPVPPGLVGPGKAPRILTPAPTRNTGGGGGESSGSS